MANQVQGNGYEPDDMVEPEKDDATPERRIAGWQRACDMAELRGALAVGRRPALMSRGLR